MTKIRRTGKDIVVSNSNRRVSSRKSLIDYARLYLLKDFSGGYLVNTEDKKRRIPC